MDALLGLTGMFGIIVTLILFIISIITKKKKKKILTAMIVFFVMFAYALSMPETKNTDDDNIVASSADEWNEQDDYENIEETIEEIIESIDTIEIETLTVDHAPFVEEIYQKYNSLEEVDKNKITNYKVLNAAVTKINYLKEEAEKELKAKQEEEKKIAEQNAIEQTINDEIKNSAEGMTQEEYKSLCVDYPYAEVVKDETTYLDTYIKKDLMVRQIVEYIPTGEKIYACGEKKDGGSYVGGLFYVFDRRPEAEKEIELYDKIYVYGKVKDLYKVSTWDTNRIDPYIDGVYITFNGKFGE